MDFQDKFIIIFVSYILAQKMKLIYLLYFFFSAVTLRTFECKIVLNIMKENVVRIKGFQSFYRFIL